MYLFQFGNCAEDVRCCGVPIDGKEIIYDMYVFLSFTKGLELTLYADVKVEHNFTRPHTNMQIRTKKRNNLRDKEKTQSFFLRQRGVYHNVYQWGAGGGGRGGGVYKYTDYKKIKHARVTAF